MVEHLPTARPPTPELTSTGTAGRVSRELGAFLENASLRCVEQIGQPKKGGRRAHTNE